MVCQALEDILEGIEFERRKTPFCEFESLWRSKVSGRLLVRRWGKILRYQLFSPVPLLLFEQRLWWKQE